MQLPLWMVVFAGVCAAQEWTEASVVQKFLEQSPYAREARARAAIAEADAKGRTLYANPSVSFSHEGAGLTQFFQAEQTLPVSGRRKLLREAGGSSVQVAQAEGAFYLWQARVSLRVAFYRTLAAQAREGVYVAGLAEMEKVIRVLRDREREGEGSKYDRMRTERERAELAAELTLVRAEGVLERSQVMAFLPPDVNIGAVAGQLESLAGELDAAELTRKALAAREDYRAELRRLEQYRLEQKAAERLRIPEPVVNAGWKRADVGLNRVGNGPVVGVSVPLPLFNKGQTEVARYAAEQDRVSARLLVLSQRMRAEIEGRTRAYAVRVQARDNYRKELAESGPELIRIATVAYQEGEIGILQLLDAYRSERQARLRMVDIQAAVKEALLELERVVGEEIGK